jgi:hypothetical protein
MLMTEAEWLACTDPEPMLEFLRSRVTERKARLFACACCRRIWHLLDGWSQNAIEIAERFVDGAVGKTGMAFAMTFTTDLHFDVVTNTTPDAAKYIAAGIANSIITGSGWVTAWNVVTEARRAIRYSSPQVDTYQESKCQAALLKDCFGNPFRPVSFDPAWLAPKVTTIAQAMYESRTFDQMPQLADALEVAGCENHDIIDHCRGPGPHIRGCWVVDLLLGKS